MIRFEGNLVGMHFRPPAKDVVNLLAANTELLIQRQPENPYDGNAIQVLLYGFCAGGQHEKIFYQMIEALREEYFPELSEEERASAESEEFEEVMTRLTDPLFLGFICNGVKTGGKVADTISPQMDAAELKTLPARLSFNEKGQPMVVVEAEFAPSNPPDHESDDQATLPNH